MDREINIELENKNLSDSFKSKYFLEMQCKSEAEQNIFYNSFLLDYLTNEYSFLKNSEDINIKRWDDYLNDLRTFIKNKLGGYEIKHRNNYRNNFKSSKEPIYHAHDKTDYINHFIRELNKDLTLPVHHIFIKDSLDGLDKYLLYYDYSNTRPEFVTFCTRVVFKNKDVLIFFLEEIIMGLIRKDEIILKMLGHSSVYDQDIREKILREIVEDMNRADDAKDERDRELAIEHQRKKKDCFFGL